MLATVRAGLVNAYDPRLVDELLAAYVEAKRNFYLGGLRLSAVEGGRFCEAAFRMLQQRATGRFVPLGQQLDTDGTIRTLAQIAGAAQPDSVRLHIPRTLRTVYDIRNRRDTAHLADGIDPNVQDATLVVSNLDWVLAEFVRLHHNVDANAAQAVVNTIVTRQAPVIQDFNGYLKVLNPSLHAGDHVLLLLYHRGNQGATADELAAWVRPSMKRNLKRTLTRLVDDEAFIHPDGAHLKITIAGQREVERRRLHQF